MRAVFASKRFRILGTLLLLWLVGIAPQAHAASPLRVGFSAKSMPCAFSGEAMEIAEAQARLAEVTAQLQALERLRKNLKH